MALNKKIKVTKSIDKDYWLCFEEKDVQKACEMADCNQFIDECIEEMRKGNCDCITCYLNLINELKVIPEYEKVIEKPNQVDGMVRLF